MYAKITIGSKEVELAANAATPRHFRNIFHRDAMKEFGEIYEGKISEMESIDLFEQAAFVMNMAARKMDMRSLTEDDFVEWLSDFETYDFIEENQKIVAVYLGNKKLLSESKKEEGQQTGLTQ